MSTVLKKILSISAIVILFVGLVSNSQAMTEQGVQEKLKQTTDAQVVKAMQKIIRQQVERENPSLSPGEIDKLAEKQYDEWKKNRDQAIKEEEEFKKTGKMSPERAAIEESNKQSMLKTNQENQQKARKMSGIDDIDSLKKQNDALQKKIGQLEKRVSALESLIQKLQNIVNGLVSK